MSVFSLPSCKLVVVNLSDLTIIYTIVNKWVNVLDHNVFFIHIKEAEVLHIMHVHKADLDFILCFVLFHYIFNHSNLI